MVSMRAVVYVMSWVAEDIASEAGAALNMPQRMYDDFECQHEECLQLKKSSLLKLFGLRLIRLTLKIFNI